MREARGIKIGLAVFLILSLTLSPAGARRAWGLAKQEPGGLPSGYDDLAVGAEEPPRKLDLNRASAEQMLRVPHLGRSTVERIIRGRPYRTVDELAKVGVSARTIEKLKPIVVFGPPSAEGPRVVRRPVVPREAIPEGKIDLNSAESESLQELPGVGPTLAREIVAGRPYRSIADLGRVRGLTPSKFAAFRDRVVVIAAESPVDNIETASNPNARPVDNTGPSTNSPTTAPLIDLNSASQQQLETLPSIGPAKAKAIIEHRPYRTIEDVMKVPGIKQGTFDRIKAQVTVGN